MNIFVVLLFVGCTKGVKILDDNITNRYFPESFRFGVASSAYQVEGAWNEDGKGENVWDRFLHDNPNRTDDQSNGDVACDSYHKWQEDVQLLVELGVSVYRLSISWARILPDGTTNKINTPGVEYYLNLFKELQANNIEPMVTLYHSDMPQHLSELGGWLNPQIADYFAEYARLAFTLYGDYVKLWVTLNEPKSICLYSYGSTSSAPGLNLIGDGVYQCAKVHLLAHAKAWHIYDEQFRDSQGGKVSLVLDSPWNEPASDSYLDVWAAEQETIFGLGWFAHPVYLGDWPSTMKMIVGNRSRLEGLSFSRLPKLTQDEITFINGTFDYFGLNIYSAQIVKYTTDPEIDVPNYWLDKSMETYGNTSWPQSSLSWLYYAPFAMRKLVNYINDKYQPGEIFITENGWADDTGELNDQDRISYYRGYLSSLLDAILDDEVNVIGYTAWCFMDNFEWTSGYTQKLGLIHVDHESSNKTRTWKASGRYYQRIIETRCLVDLCEN